MRRKKFADNRIINTIIKFLISEERNLISKGLILILLFIIIVKFPIPEFFKLFIEKIYVTINIH